MNMWLYRTRLGVLVQNENRYHRVAGTDWDQLVNRADLAHFLESFVHSQTELPEDFSLQREDYLPPIVGQEVWAAGVTYTRSKNARMEESESSGGGSFYDRVYAAERPELFPKALPHRVAGHMQPIRIRRDSKWNVPEPELTILASVRREVVGYTIGNDVSSRDIEGENPLYLPQAKVYDRSCSLGPGVLIRGDPLPGNTRISIAVLRAGEEAFKGETTLSGMKRTVEELLEYLYRECSFPQGCFLMTGTGIVPPTGFSLRIGDSIRITVTGVGCLVNQVT